MSAIEVSKPIADSNTVDNGRKTFEILTEIYQDEFILNLLYVTKMEDKDSFSKMAILCKQIDATMTSKTSSISSDFKTFYSSEIMLGKILNR